MVNKEKIKVRFRGVNMDNLILTGVWSLGYLPRLVADAIEIFTQDTNIGCTKSAVEFVAD